VGPAFGKGNGNYGKGGKKKKKTDKKEKGREKKVKGSFVKFQGKNSAYNPEEDKDKGNKDGHARNTRHRPDKKRAPKKHEKETDNKNKPGGGTAG
jgi:hypothetical protein